MAGGAGTEILDPGQVVCSDCKMPLPSLPWGGRMKKERSDKRLSQLTPIVVSLQLAPIVKAAPQLILTNCPAVTKCWLALRRTWSSELL